VAGMMITSNHDAHMSTRNTRKLYGTGPGGGHRGGAMCSRNCGTRELAYADLRKALVKDNVYFE